MKFRSLLPLLLATAALSTPLHAETATTTAAETAPNQAIIAQPRNTWMDIHDRYVQTVKKAKPDLLFIGDSITAGWNGAGKAIWIEKYLPLNAVNLGIGGDRTENVLWRLQNGELDGVQPKVAMLMIGTNNHWRNTPTQIAEGVTAIVKEIGQRSPTTKILLLGIFPRDEAGTPKRLNTAEVNKIIAKLNDDKTVFYLDIGDKFLQPDGTLSKEIMPDLLHLSPKGYQIWSDAVAGKLAELLK